jgi:hypothetical protein
MQEVFVALFRPGPGRITCAVTPGTRHPPLPPDPGRGQLLHAALPSDQAEATAKQHAEKGLHLRLLKAKST